MDLKRLETFRLVAQSGSLRHAAAHIGLTLSAVSTQIRKLEKEIGTELFEHLPNRLVLTERGKLFLNKLDGVFQALERATAAACGDLSVTNAGLSVVLETDLFKCFSQEIATFARENPGINLAAQSRSSYKGLAMLVDKEVDMSIGFHQTVPKGIERICLRQTGLWLAYPSSMDFPGDRSVLDEITNHRLIMPARPSSTRRIIESILTKKSISSDGTIEVGSCQGIMAFVQLGLGLGLVHDTCACAEPFDNVRFMDVRRHFGTVDIVLASRKDTLSRPAHQAFAEVLLHSAGERHRTPMSVKLRRPCRRCREKRQDASSACCSTARLTGGVHLAAMCR